MKSITINVNNDKLADKVIELLKSFKNEGLEIVSREDLNDLRLHSAT